MLNPAIDYLSQRNRYIYLLVLPLVVMVMVSAMIVLKDRPQPDLIIYYEYSLKIIQGQVPYRDFLVEYPPFALLPMLVPQILNGLFSHSLLGYLILFLIQK